MIKIQIKPLSMAILVTLLALLIAGCGESSGDRRARQAESRAAAMASQRDKARQEAAAAKREAEDLRKKLAAARPWWKTALWVAGGLVVGGVIGAGVGTGIPRTESTSQRTALNGGDPLCGKP